jgi:hypothetical protein
VGEPITVTDGDFPDVEQVSTRNTIEASEKYARVVAAALGIVNGSVTDANPADVEVRRAKRKLREHAYQIGSCCSLCDKGLAPSDTVWWDKLSWENVFGPVCEDCASPADDYRLHIERECVGCGRKVVDVVGRWWLRRRTRPTCSRRCYWTYQSSVRAERHAGQRERSCRGCGTLFTPPRSDGKYCSAACRQKAYRQRVGGRRG